LTGCIVDADRPKFSEIFDYLLDIKDLNQWPALLGLNKITDTDADYFHVLPRRAPAFSVFIPISKGCDNYCTYCVVPYTRGPLVSRPTNDIMEETRLAAENGAKEIWLLGQNVNNYHYQNIDFAKLLHLVNDVPGDFWIRFTSPHPKDFGADAINAMAQCEKVTPYLNLPIQSGDNTVLKAMGRPYTVSRYLDLVKKIRQAFRTNRQGIEKQVALSTDIIVGFPGETKTQFANSVKAFKTIKYDMAYIAQYSRRAGTAAAKLDDNVTPKEKKRREEVLNNILKKTALAHCKKFVGEIVEVLVDSSKIENKNGKTARFLLGKSRHYKTVKIPYEAADINPGDIVKVKITKAQSFGLIGKLVIDPNRYKG